VFKTISGSSFSNMLIYLRHTLTNTKYNLLYYYTTETNNEELTFDRFEFDLTAPIDKLLFF